MDKLIIEFNKKFDKQKQELIDGFKALGEEKRLPKVLATIEGEQPTYKDYFKAGWQSRQSEFDAMTEALLNQTQLLAKQKVEIEEKDKRITELEKSEFALAKVKQILNKHIKTRLLESIIVRELIDLLFSNKG